MSKARELQSRERLEDLKLRSAIAATGYAVTSDFHPTREQLERQAHEAEFRAMQAEEAAEIEAARRKQPAFLVMSQQWNRPVDELIRTVGTLLPDIGAAELLPLTDQPVGDVSQTYADFRDLLKSRSIALSREGFNRLVTYMNVASRTSQIKDGQELHVAADTIDAWILADRRLCELSETYANQERAELLEESKPEPVNETADDLRAAAEQEWSKFPLWHAWEESLLAGFGVRLQDSDRRRVCEEFVRANLSPYAADSYDTVRQMLVARERFPLRQNGEPALTVDERMAQLTENYNLSNPAERRAWCHEIGRLRAILGE